MTGPIFCDPDDAVAERLRADCGAVGVVYTSLGDLRDHLMNSAAEDTVVLGPGVGDSEAFAVADVMRFERPHLGVVLVREELTAPLLQEALRAGVREVVHHRDTLGLQSAVKRSAHLATNLRDKAPIPVERAPHPQGRVVTVFSAKGGTGKTMLAVNLGATLADHGRRRVVVVDLDLTAGDVAVMMQLFPSRTVLDAVPLKGALDASEIADIATQHSPGLDIIAAPVEPSTADSVPPVLISDLLAVLRDVYDFIVVDTAARFDDQVLAALDSSDQIELLATPDVPSLKNLKITLETLAELSYDPAKFRLVLNRSDAKVGITHAEVEKTARLPIAAQIPGDRDVPVSVNNGVPLVIADPRHAVSRAIAAFAEREILQQRGDDPDPPKKKRRLWS